MLKLALHIYSLGACEDAPKLTYSALHQFQLLGLQLLGFGLGGSGQSASADGTKLSPSASSLDRNSSSVSSSSQQPVYQHPISLERISGAKNNQLSENLAAPLAFGPLQQRVDGPVYPLDHYQRQQAPPTQRQPGNFEQLNALGAFEDHPPVNPFGDSGHIHLSPTRQAPTGFEPHMMHGPPPPPGPMSMRQPHHPHFPPPMPPPVPRMQHPADPLNITQVPMGLNTNKQPLPFSSIPFASNNVQQQVPNLPSGASYMQNTQRAPTEPTYYTPPIFTYGQQDGGGAQSPASHHQMLGANPTLMKTNQPIIQDYLAPLLSVPESESHSLPGRQNPARPMDQHATSRNSNAINSNTNLLANSMNQQQYGQQNSPLMFAPASQQQRVYNMGPHNETLSPAYYQDPAAYKSPSRDLHATRSQASGAQLRPPDHTASQGNIQSRVLTSPESKHSSSNPQTIPGSSNALAHHHPPAAPKAKQPQTAKHQPPGSIGEPSCVRQQATSLNDSSNSINTQPGLVLFCGLDSEYPTTEVMRALEAFAMDRGSIEQVLPQQLVQFLLAGSASLPADGAANMNQLEFRRHLVMDPLQPYIEPNFGAGRKPGRESIGEAGWFPSGNYEPMCRASTFMAQPRRARNLHGHWKVVVNLPGHKYRGVAVSQMVRLEECTKPNLECSGAPSSIDTKRQQNSTPNSSCLQHYDTHRLLVWSPQQGLHIDLFRLPSACSCHLRR